MSSYIRSFLSIIAPILDIPVGDSESFDDNILNYYGISVVFIPTESGVLMIIKPL